MLLRGASADAVAELESRLADQVSASSEQAATTGEELFAASRTLRHEPALRRFVSDASVPTEARTGLVRQVFDGQVGQACLDLLAEAVSRRWTAGGDLPAGLEHLSVVALVRSAGDDTARLSDELFALDQAVRDNPALRDALADPGRSTADKEALVRGLLDGKALEATMALANQSLSGSHRTVTSALEEYQKVAASVHGENVATVRVARELSDDEARRLASALERQYDRSVHLNVVVEPDLLGGIRVEIGDEVIDGTVAARLADARRRFAGAST